MREAWKSRSLGREELTHGERGGDTGRKAESSGLANKAKTMTNRLNGVKNGTRWRTSPLAERKCSSARNGAETSSKGGSGPKSGESTTSQTAKRSGVTSGRQN